MTIKPEEIKNIEPTTSELMEISEFVLSDEVDPIYFDASYHIIPELAGQKAYALVVKGMEQSKYVAVAKLAMHNREYTVIIRNYQNGLLLHTMYYENEVRPVEENKLPKEEPKPEEVKMVKQFFSALVTDWEPKKYKDEFREQIQNLILSKVEGKESPKKTKKTKSAPVPDLLEAIRKSMEQAQERKQQKKAK